MKQVKIYGSDWLLILMLVCSLAATSAQAQSITKQADDNRTMQALLNEVRLLRQTLQRTGLNAYRSQIILDRIRASNEQVLRLTRTLEDIRNEVEKTENTIPRMKEQVKVLETHIEQETDANKRARLEFEHKDVKRSIEYYKVRLEQLREREQQLSTQLREQQTKLAELESRLDGLEREIENELERQRAEDKTKEGNKQP
jgi:predicted  nucleic acid-binding Zn-ribbon protein